MLDNMCLEFAELKAKKKGLEDEAKAVGKKIEQLEQEICEKMIEDEKPDVTVDGVKYSLTQKTMYSKASEETLLEKGIVFFDVLRDVGLGDIIVEKVDPRTLNSTVRNMAEENDGVLPEELEEALNIYEKLGISARKANTKALDRAKENRK